MHYTLHLTNDCNMDCSYCYVDKQNVHTMDIKTAQKVVDMAAGSSASSIGIIFFGGEPLLHKGLIEQVIEYGNWMEQRSDCHFHYKVTTNGLLLDKDFIELSIRENIFIALSHDGVQKAHDRHRIDSIGQGTFDRLSDKVDILLSARPYSPVMMTVNPDTVQYYAKSVEYLYDRGFRYLICSLNYAADWTDECLDILKEEYLELAEFYYDRTTAEDKFYLSPFEVKISSHINWESYCHERCELGKKQLSVAPDGFIYPCIQFVGDKEYAIGHVDFGIDEDRRLKLYYLNDREKDSCRECAIRNRCNHYCGCMNKQATGRIDRVSPVLCAHERILLPIVDKLAVRLFKERNAMFIQKHYNDMYPLVSMIEDVSLNAERNRHMRGKC